MIDSNILEYSKLEPLIVSRETFSELEEFRTLIINKNKEINLISSNSEPNSRERHIIDSAQIIDFIDKNDKTLVDLGSGAGFPGLVLAMVLNDRKIPLQVKLIEKSPKKVKFLKNLIKELNLSVEVMGNNIIKEQFSVN